MRLRPFTLEDEAQVLSWRNDPAVRRNMYTHEPIAPETHRIWFAKVLVGLKGLYFICEDDTGDGLGVVGFTDISESDKKASWAFYKRPGAPKGTGKAMEFLALDYAFNTLRLETLSCEVLAHNEAVYYLHRKAGFQVEGVFKRAHAFEGARHDIYRLALHKADYPDCLTHPHVGETHSYYEYIRPGDVEAFAHLTGDYNVVHFGPKRIAHGMLTAAIISAAIADKYRGAYYLAQDLKFVAAAPVDDGYTVTLKAVSEIRRKLWLETVVTRDGGTVVLKGEALILLPKPATLDQATHTS